MADDGFETIRVKRGTKVRLEDLQEKERVNTGRRPVLSVLVEDALDALELTRSDKERRLTPRDQKLAHAFHEMLETKEEHPLLVQARQMVLDALTNWQRVLAYVRQNERIQ